MDTEISENLNMLLAWAEMRGLELSIIKKASIPGWKIKIGKARPINCSTIRALSDYLVSLTQAEYETDLWAKETGSDYTTWLMRQWKMYQFEY